MKKLLTLLFAIFAIVTASAQSEKSIIIDQNSFCAVQSDALTGVNIDPIGMDSSRRSCARIKVKINRMTHEEINQIEVKIVTNNELRKCKTADYDNGLIIEMTAKPSTRFYFNHPDFGESNEVMLNLDPSKEYYMEASLNQTYSIFVNSNVAGADVYIDNIYKGRTGDNYNLTVSEVLVGPHTLRVEYGNIKQEQSIDVNKNSIAFNQTINIAASEPQFVVFAVQPHNAVVIIDNKHYVLEDGAMSVLLPTGVHNYTVTAAGYHSQSGNFVVEGQKVTRNITLVVDAATVTLTAPDNAEIWINKELRGCGSWSGTLSSGTYIFEARKSGHKSGTMSMQITSDRPTQSYTLPAPSPIYGSLVVEGSPIMADVVLDGENIGQIPLKVDKILVGTHTLTISKSGYSTDTQIITVDEGRITEVVVKLNKNLISDLKGVTPIEIDSSLTAEQLNSKGVELDNNGDYNSAVQYFYEAAKREYAVAQYNLGNCYYVGKCVTKDYAEAAKWYLKAAELGHKFAQNNLGACYEAGIGVPANITEAVKWYRKSAEQGHAVAQNNLGICYCNGKGVTQDYSEAVMWFIKAAEQENADAQNNLGICYYNGQGVAQDYSEAAKWYLKAVAQGHAFAQNNLGALYNNGQGVAQDYNEAAKWFLKSAEQGVASAQNNLGRCYEEGLGVTKKLSEARKWYRKAAEQGNENAKKRLQALD